MATKKEGEQNVTPKASKTIRKVKNPETFRERAIKASEQSQQPGKRSRLGSVAGRPVKPLVSGVRAVGRNRVFRIVTWPLRLLGRILFPKYFRNSYRELKQVHWPDRSESRKLTTAVLIFSIIFGVIVGLVDFGLDKLFREVLIK